MKKSQSAIEFLVFFSLAVVILMLYLGVSYNFLGISLRNKDNILAGDLVKELKNEINLAGLSYDGYEKNYTLPPNINNKDYTVSIPSGEREVTVILEGNHYTESLATEVYKAISEINPGDKIYILKQNNDVYISIFLECSQSNLNEIMCGFNVQCQHNDESIPDNYACSIKCQFVENIYQWRITQFCDSVECSEGECGAPINYYPCGGNGEQCDYIYGNQGCANHYWTILGICNQATLPAICCINPGQGGGS